MQLTVERPLSTEEIEDYVFPWQSLDRARSWMAMAGAADSRYTLDLLPAPESGRGAHQPHLGRDDEFQKISFARRYVAEVPASDLVEVAGRDIPVENSPHEIAGTMMEHFAAR